MNVFGFYSFRQRVAPIYLKKQSLREKKLHRSPGNGTFFFGLPRSVTTWVWNWLVRLETSGLLHNLSFWSLSMFLFLSCLKEIFGGFFVYDFASFHPDKFRNTISWKCFMENDSVRSRLIELQSFSYSKIDVDPIHSVLMPLPCFMHVLCKTRCSQVDRVKILVLLIHRIHKQKEYCLSVAQNLTFQCQS